MITISISAFILVLIFGIVAIVAATTKEKSCPSTFWFWLCVWVALLAWLWPGAALIAVH